ncbi:MAG: hypothetical protein EPN75_10715 [Beijerinckiaceae bacterium]|nr:MAG: hypothetical protein EPN75_10715 [Beijerinckiaceae bacterium]
MAARQPASARAVNASPELIAAILRPNGAEAPAAAARAAEGVPRSYRAAILAGFIVAILNAAVHVTLATKTATGLGHIGLGHLGLGLSLGSEKVPLAAALILGSLWSAAQSSAMCLLVAHRLLVRARRTSYAAYMAGAGAAALVLGVVMWLFGSPPGPGGFAMLLVSGVVTGFFYRMFAGTKPRRS